ncbi:MAG: endonuclease III, partial [Patescibacteria group bacterium]
MTKHEWAREILRRLRKTYTKKPEDFVLWKTPLELLIATVLSAQCTDKKVNEVTRVLFKKFRTAQDYAGAPISALETAVHSTGFYKTKAKYLKGIGQLLVEKFGGRVPKTREALITLPGVSYKTANLIMAKAYGILTGVAVDTHVNR